MHDFLMNCRPSDYAGIKVLMDLCNIESGNFKPKRTFTRIGPYDLAAVTLCPLDHPVLTKYI